MAPTSFPLHHSSHDYTELTDRWQKLARDTGGQLDIIATVQDLPVFSYETSPDSDLPIYLSAGVHGDESAPVWALLEWAEANLEVLKNRSCLIFPCLNPHGLIENQRLDQNQIDLNRRFQDRTLPVLSGWHQKVESKRFSRCINLHEDYDARGVYLYEIANPPGLGRQVLDAGSSIIPCESAAEIDGQVFDHGLCQHEGDGIREVVEGHLQGYPEAIYLFLNHSDTTLTFETPSEMAIETRIAAQRAAIERFFVG